MIKEAVITAFSRKAATYAQHARVQHQSARKLAAFLAEHKSEVVAGSVLELGCGTGFFTEHLLELFPDREIVVTDLAPDMLSQCRANVPSHANVTFRLMDAERIELSTIPALIATSFTLQWLSDLGHHLDLLTNCLSDSGQLFFSVPVSGSFQEWQQMCSATNIPFTANDLPTAHQLNDWCLKHNYQFEAKEHKTVCTFDCALSFFRSLKNIGASINTSGNRLSMPDFNRLLSFWDSQFPAGVEITYVVLTGRIVKRIGK